MNTPAKTAADVVDQMQKTSTEVTVPQVNAVTITDHKPEDDFADMRKRDIMTPRLALLQPTSPLVIEGQYKGGQFIDGTSVVIDMGKVEKFIPVTKWLHWTEWNPDRDAPADKKILSRSFDINSWQAKAAEGFHMVKDPHGKEKLKITEYFNFILILPGAHFNLSNMFMFSFARSSHKIGKVFLNRMMRTRQPNGEQAAMYMNQYELGSKLKTEGNNRWFEPTIGPVATPTPEEYWPEIKEMVIALKNRKAEMEARMIQRELEEAAEIAKHTGDAQDRF
jgi:hypothetical protein